MSGKTSYMIFLSFMALFAALAAHAGEPERNGCSTVRIVVGN